MGELGTRQLRSFDPLSAEVYAAISSDNRLRLWNTVRVEINYLRKWMARNRAKLVGYKL